MKCYHLSGTSSVVVERQTNIAVLAGDTERMKIFGKVIFIILELVAFLLSAFVILGVVVSDPFPRELLFWRCGSWSACLISSSFTYLMIFLAPLIILHWALSLKKIRAGKN